MNTKEIDICAKNLVNFYSDDLEDTFVVELEQFIPLLKGMAYTDKVFCRTGHNVFN